jgi:glycosyltransferase XagB
MLLFPSSVVMFESVFQKLRFYEKLHGKSDGECFDPRKSSQEDAMTSQLIPHAPARSLWAEAADATPEPDATSAYCRSLARECNLKFIEESSAPVLAFGDRPPAPMRLLTSRMALPLKNSPAPAALNAALFSPLHLVTLTLSLGADAGNVALMTRQGLIDAIGRTYGGSLVKRAAFGLKARQPHFSAATGAELWQLATLAAAAGLALGVAIVSLRDAVVAAGAILSLAFLLAVLIRFAAALHLLSGRAQYSSDKCSSDKCSGGAEQVAPCCDADDPTLPAYSVLVPVHREERVLPTLVAALKRLEYPKEKLDIKIIVEAGDHATIAAAQALDLGADGIDLIIAPQGGPQTKPKALNYALAFATGEHLVIYDAEDQPDPKQLLKAAARFRAASHKMACLQAALIFHNHQENWLAKQFTIEYASLFDGILPMLGARRLPLPLGGTSNHFRVDALKAVGGWDPHNVTEDADLGMRLYRAGYVAETLDSTTYEEAACQLGNWIRQRTRWLKGWMQTYLVHMRRPVQLFKELGPGGFLAFQGYFAGIIVSALAHPWFHLLLLRDIISGALFEASLTPLQAPFWIIAGFNFFFGYASSLSLGWLAVRKRGMTRLASQVLFIPLYWLLVSVAAYRALHQLIKAPFYWEKTEHGLSALTTLRLDAGGRRHRRPRRRAACPPIPESHAAASSESPRRRAG